MRNLKAELVETPGEEKPYKVVVTRQGVLVSEQAVGSRTAAEAMIKDMEKLSRDGRFEL